MASEGLTRRVWLTGAGTLATRAARSAQPADPLAWTLSEAAAELAKGSVSSEELTKLCLAWIAKLDRSLNAFITVNGDSAVAQARECDRLRRAGRVSSRLHGVPIALKDNIDTAGMKTTAAARVFEDRVDGVVRKADGRGKARDVAFGEDALGWHRGRSRDGGVDVEQSRGGDWDRLPGGGGVSCQFCG
jgi:Amidase